MGALATVKATPTALSPSAEKAQPNADRTSSMRRLYASRNTGIGPVSKSASPLSKKAANCWACRRGHRRRLDELFGRISARRF